MTTRDMWAERVKDWRASGLTAPAYAEGKEFAASTLRYWSSRLEQEPPSVRIARLVRVAAPAAAEPALLVEVAGARVEVRRGFDRETLQGVVEVLKAAR